MDIEEDYRLQESLLARTRELQLVMDNVGVPMAYIDADRRFRFANAPGPDWPPEITFRQRGGQDDRRGLPARGPGEGRGAGRIAPWRARRSSTSAMGRNRRGEQRWVRVTLMPDVVGGEGARRLLRDDRHRRRQAPSRGPGEAGAPAALLRREHPRGDRVRRGRTSATSSRTRPSSGPRDAGRGDRRAHRPGGAGRGGRGASTSTPFVERLVRGETCTYERLAGPRGRREALVPGAPRAAHGRGRAVRRLLHRRHRHPRGEARARAPRGPGGEAAPLHRQRPGVHRLPGHASAATCS